MNTGDSMLIELRQTNTNSIQFSKLSRKSNMHYYYTFIILLFYARTFKRHM